VACRLDGLHLAIGTYHVVRRRHDSDLQQPQLQLYSN
jgi:hypothetical protein